MAPNSTTFIIRYAEIALKGKNRKDFELQLVANIRQVVGSSVISISRDFGQILLSTPSSASHQVSVKLRQIFGISWFAEAKTIHLDLEQISTFAVSEAKKLIKPEHTFAVRAERSSKNIPFTSLDIERQIGQSVRLATQSQVNLSHPDHTIFIYLTTQQAYLFSHKITGPGGLPVGSSGKILALLSGGFDSIAASYQLARRGTQVDFLHFHIFTDKQKVIDSKIYTIAAQLSAYTQSTQIYLASNLPYQIAILDLPKGLEKQELIVFRRLMARVGERLAQKHGYQALVLGDSLGQVASQTIENIVAVDQATDIPIFRPLIGSDKVDIINLIKDIGLESVANLPYKDCCSIISHHPATTANLSKIHAIEKHINIDKLVDQIIDQIEVCQIS